MKWWFPPLVQYSLRFFEKCRQPVIKFWSLSVPVCETGHILKGFKNDMMYWGSNTFFSLNEIELILKPAERKFG